MEQFRAALVFVLFLMMLFGGVPNATGLSEPRATVSTFPGRRPARSPYTRCAQIPQASASTDTHFDNNLDIYRALLFSHTLSCILSPVHVPQSCDASSPRHELPTPAAVSLIRHFACRVQGTLRLGSTGNKMDGAGWQSLSLILYPGAIGVC